MEYSVVSKQHSCSPAQYPRGNSPLTSKAQFKRLFATRTRDLLTGVRQTLSQSLVLVGDGHTRGRKGLTTGVVNAQNLAPI